MAKKEGLNISELLAKKEKEILDAWTKAQADITAFKKGLITEKQLREESARFLGILVRAVAGGNLEDITAPEYDEVNKFLANFSVSRASIGFSPSETATYIFSLKDTVLRFLQDEFGDQPAELSKAVIGFSMLMDKLGLITVETYVKAREDVIREQQKSLLEISTPVIQVWEEILVLPLIGTIDSARAKQIMENLLESIVATKSSIVIMDITGVPAVDTEVANRLLRTMQAAKLMGAECVLTGISPQISQTLVHIGVDLSGVTTRASLRDGLALAFRKLKLKVTKMEV
ncbi:MAG: anti-anti-sigma factor [Syntrophaceae bacterium CG2_30_49_12]|nr:MAG: anti-anti-sigma factor [Syntrophaceae bacterium CG2_30_49_12]PIP06951.1 MAG: anti-anti-sigma factor [Syntrophobacterales bacterium CG23_combo_of_CG06-09_8_20_14_all_48_27]